MTCTVNITIVVNCKSDADDHESDADDYESDADDFESDATI